MYPDGGVEEMVTDMRYLLAWVKQEIRCVKFTFIRLIGNQQLIDLFGMCSKYDGSPSRIFLVGHGLGAHLAMYTIAQDAVVKSRDARQASFEEKRQNQVMTTLNGTPMGRWGGARRGQSDEELPNGLRALSIYAGEVELPAVRGIILCVRSTTAPF